MWIMWNPCHLSSYFHWNLHRYLRLEHMFCKLYVHILFYTDCLSKKCVRTVFFSSSSKYILSVIGYQMIPCSPLLGTKLGYNQFGSVFFSKSIRAVLCQCVKCMIGLGYESNIWKYRRWFGDHITHVCIYFWKRVSFFRNFTHFLSNSIYDSHVALV